MSNRRLEILETRSEILETVLRYDSEKKGKFSRGERIMINQERAHLYKQTEDPEVDNYNQSLAIETKIYKCLALIRQENWKPKPFVPEY
ncbi:hypothetical protein [Flavobacterium psychrophilum]|uniref:hypothetical protein n=1 Tax=Flavobacterium psychrophilum TaxID=96345 RepID=UPI000B7C1533|nr:hypothetical protein [Flavobacterium psychrophilum]SNA87647.1 hypothetical protein DK095_70035 [Flavobacterium psychrophilum]SNB10888.1 hypothetical protein JIP1600_1930013 [Flavobacterium psychrophilum]